MANIIQHSHLFRVARHMLKYSLYTFGLMSLLVACVDSRPHSQEGGLDGSSQNLYAQFIDRARQVALASASETSKSANSQPTAVFIHPDAPFEFWVFLAILHDQQDNYYALQQRFAKLRVGSTATANVSGSGSGSGAVVDVPRSKWDYSDVVALDYQLDHLTAGTSDTQTLVQRAALDLSGADASTQRVWVGAFDVQSDATPICHTSKQVNSPMLKLQFGDPNVRRSGCDDQQVPGAQIADGFSLLDSPALPVTGSYVYENQNIELSGYGWELQGWGVPPNLSGAAVVFDRAWFLLNDKTGVQLQRSRRASGRGPQITTGYVQSLDETSNKAAISAVLVGQFTDGQLGEDNKRPLSWQLASPENDLALTLTPVTVLNELQTTVGQSRFSVVEVEGSDDGYGFVDYILR